MNICIIGSTGHYGYIMDAVKSNDACILGVAPGSAGEDMSGICGLLEQLNYPFRRFEDYRVMLDTLKPDIAVICCYFCDNAKAAVEAMRRGIHVFAEKPAATSLEDLESVEKVYKSSGVFYASMFGIRYNPWFMTAHEIVRTGKIGKVRLMNAQKSYKLGVRGDNFKFRKIYGGTIPWVGSHAIDWLHWISGERFQSVYASHSCLYNRNHGELEVSALCQFGMSNDVSGSVSIDYLRPDSAEGHADDRIRIVGTDGIVEVRNEKVYLMNSSDGGAEVTPFTEESDIFSDFLKQLRGEGNCIISAEDSFYIAEASLRARISADEKRIVFFGG